MQALLIQPFRGAQKAHKRLGQELRRSLLQSSLSRLYRHLQRLDLNNVGL